jgi:hypothetical protein
MKDKSTNKWLIIIIILFISFIIIPIILRVFNIKEGNANPTNKDINKNIKQVENTVNTINNNTKIIKNGLGAVNSAAGVINAANTKLNNATNSLNNANQKVNTASTTLGSASGTLSGVKKDTTNILDSRATETAIITKNDNDNRDIIRGGTDSSINLTKMYNAIMGISDLIPKSAAPPPIDYKTRFDTYNNSLNGMTGQINAYSTNLNDLNTDLSRNIMRMSDNIVAYNTANLTNSKTVFDMNQNVTTANQSYLATIGPINTNIDAINAKLQTFDFEKLNNTMAQYNKDNLELTGKILSRLDGYETDFTNYKAVLDDRLRINPTIKNQ